MTLPHCFALSASLDRFNVYANQYIECEDRKAVWQADTALQEWIDNSPCLKGFIAFITDYSPYLSRLITAHPEVVKHFLEGHADTYCTKLIATIHNIPGRLPSYSQAQAWLRIQKQRIALMVALADISEYWNTATVTSTLSHFADGCVAYALHHAYLHTLPASITRPPSITQSGITILALGKLGGYELNYSSDIDLIALYDPEKLDMLAPAARNQFAVRVIRHLSGFLQDRQEEGYVFRVDLRLRPDPASTGLAVALGAATHYYESVGQNWERAAMIKARHIAGDSDTAQHFLTALQPFIWRNHLDYAAIEDILSIKRQMQAKEEPDISLPGHHIKTGYGGIREIEFLAQIHQLIWGGRIPALRAKSTCEVLALLADHDLLDADIVHDLTHAYYTYRMIEHRLQMRLDQQTHRLPSSPEGMDRLAQFCHVSNTGHFTKALLEQLHYVHNVFIHTFHESTPLGYAGKLVFTGVDHDRETIDNLMRMGFSNPKAISTIIRQWHTGDKRCTRTKRARELLTELVPVILQHLAETADPDRAFRQFDAFLDGLPIGVQPFSLFQSHPHLLSLIADITGNAPVLARKLTYYPYLLDLLVDQHLDISSWGAKHAYTMLDEQLTLARDEEEAIEYFCNFKLEREFAAGIALLRGILSPQQTSTYLTRLADSMVMKAVELARSQLEHRNIINDDHHFAIIGLGKLGTRELMIGSDLDVMCIYNISDECSPEDQEHWKDYYKRLTTRVIHLLSYPTKTGALYEMDTKLRPYGSQGALAVGLDTFATYYARDSWIVENLALLQARIIYTSDAIAGTMEQALCQAQDISFTMNEISDAIYDTRRKISDQYFSSNPWDIKYVWGGMMDLQWIVKALLADQYHNQHYHLHKPSTLHHLQWLYEQEILDEWQHDILRDAYQLYHQVLSYLRLCHEQLPDDKNLTKGLQTLLARVMHTPNFHHLRQQLLRAQSQVYHLYKNLPYMTG